jgi:hypothetical protein
MKINKVVLIQIQLVYKIVHFNRIIKILIIQVKSQKISQDHPSMLVDNLSMKLILVDRVNLYNKIINF